MKQEWVEACLRCSGQRADFYSGARKILRHRSIVFEEWENDLTLADCGYTKTKMGYLRRGYLHEESRDVAKQLWARRVAQRKYGSVGFTCYNHLIKNDPNKKSKRASVMGPCIQSICLTLLNDQSVAVSAFYRTTELFKKFPADLVFIQQELLEGFQIDRLHSVEFSFANITIHPMYFVTIIPMIKDPIASLERIREKDPYFHMWIIKWTARYIVPEYHRGIAKFAQAMRVHKDANERIEPEVLTALQDYCILHHPGHRTPYREKKS